MGRRKKTRAGIDCCARLCASGSGRMDGCWRGRIGHLGRRQTWLGEESNTRRRCPETRGSDKDVSAIDWRRRRRFSLSVLPLVLILLLMIHQHYHHYYHPHLPFNTRRHWKCRRRRHRDNDGRCSCQDENQYTHTDQVNWLTITHTHILSIDPPILSSTCHVKRRKKSNENIRGQIRNGEYCSIPLVGQRVRAIQQRQPHRTWRPFIYFPFWYRRRRRYRSRKKEGGVSIRRRKKERKSSHSSSRNIRDAIEKAVDNNTIEFFLQFFRHFSDFCQKIRIKETLRAFDWISYSKWNWLAIMDADFLKNNQRRE